MPTTTKIHLVVLIHGLFGSDLNLSEARHELLEAAASLSDQHLGSDDAQSDVAPPRVHVLVPGSFPGSLTYDGIEVLAARVAKEIDQEILRLETPDLGSNEKAVVTHFSVMGYSLGGLIARYLIALLHSRSPSFFANITPASFSTIATPHIGIPRYETRASRLKHAVGSWMFSRSGQELFCVDKSDKRGRSLLEIMADPNLAFIHSLQLFPSLQIIANGIHDQTVPYPSAAISTFDPFAEYEKTGVDVHVDETHIVLDWERDEGYSAGERDSEGGGEIVGVNAVEARKRLTAAKEIAAKAKDRANGSIMVGGRKRSWMPPPLQAIPWPMNYILIALSPFIIPIIFVYLTGLMIYQTYRSSQRRRLPLMEQIPLIIQDDSYYPSDSDAEEQEETQVSTPNSLVSPSSSSFSGTGTSTPVFKMVTPLLLSSSQKKMIKNLNENLPNMKKIVAWYPWAYNSHATIIVRDKKRFPAHEDGRGLLKLWSKEVVSAALPAKR